MVLASGQPVIITHHACHLCVQVHFVTAADLSSKYFTSAQLPHSLGGTYVPGPQRSHSNPTSKPPAHHRHHANGEGVTSLVKSIGGSQLGTGHTPSSGNSPKPPRPHPPLPHSRPKPVPPSKISRVGPITPPKGKSRDGGGDLPLSQPPFRRQTGNGDLGHRGDSSKPRVPLLPKPSGTSKPPSSSLQSVAPPPTMPSFPGKVGSPTRGSAGIKGHTGGAVSNGGELKSVASRIRKLENKKSSSHDWHGSTKDVDTTAEERARSGSAGSQGGGSSGSQGGGSPSQSKQSSPSKGKKPQKPLIPVKLLSGDSAENHKEVRSKDSTNADRHVHSGRPGHVTTATKTERTSPRVPPPHAPPPPTPTQPQVHDVSPYASSAFAMGNTSHAHSSTNHAHRYEDGGEYENLEITQPAESSSGRGHQQAQPAPSCYENVVVKKAHKPRPPVHRQSSIPTASDTYENVEFQPLPSKPSSAGPRPPSEEHVSDDDDVLFGKEGPPGMAEVIYENFGPDAGNKQMSVDELEKHIRSKESKGLSAEYLKIKNEPLCGRYTACRSVSLPIDMC